MDQQNLPHSSIHDTLPSSTLAIVSLISALLGFSFMPLLGGIVALIAGYLARKETHSIPPKASGDGMAIAGIIMGWIQIAIVGLFICCWVLGILFYWFPLGRPNG